MSKSYILLVLTALIIAVGSSAQGQNVSWVNTQYHNIQYNPELSNFQSCTDRLGNTFTTVINQFKVAYGQDFYGDALLKKYNTSGSLVMSKLFAGRVNFEALTTDQSGNLYASGSFMDSLVIDSANKLFNTGTGFNLNYFLIKLDKNGGFIWAKNINAIYGQYTILDAIHVRGSSLYAGIYYYDIGTVYKYDLNGNQLMLIQQSNVRSVSSITTDNLGNIIVSGACGQGNITFGNLVLYTPFPYNVYIAKYNPSGICQWGRFVEDITFQRADLACDSENNIYAAGDLFDSTWFGNIRAIGRQWVFDFFITKIDPSGEFLWVKEVPNYPGSPTGDVRRGKTRSLAIDKNDRIYFAAVLRGTVDWGNGFKSVSAGGNDILLLTFDDNGTMMSIRDFGGTSNERPDCISIDENGSMYMSGNFALNASFDTISVSGTGYINSFTAKIPFGGSQGTVLLSMIMQGFYNQYTEELITGDTVRLYLRGTSSPFVKIDSAVSVISKTNFTGAFTFANAASGSYYIQANHRNTVETWSSAPVQFERGGTTEFSFVNAQSSAFGNNQMLVDNMPVRYALFGGDVDQDGTVDANDASIIDNDAYNVLSGYIPSDVTGDGFVDGSDASLADNNAFNFVQKIVP
ncbi:MAG: hypothetical protein K1X85_00110 [Ignavibacteria bacterium]|nr:hypothetical protein [Ignavibacteria bacterium]